MNMSRVHALVISWLLSGFVLFLWITPAFAVCQTVPSPSYNPSEALLSVNVQGIENGIVPVNSTFDVTWTSDESIPPHDKLYEFIIFSMPNTVRFKGSGFLMLPPETKLPFGFKFDQDHMRVVFPLYLLKDKTKGTFQIRSLVAGQFTLKWDYVVVNECGDIVFSFSNTLNKKQLITFEVQDQNPIIIVQDRVGIEEPEQVLRSPSGEYEVYVFKDRFQVFYANTGNLIFEKAGTNPNFSPGSRFLGYDAPSFEVIDLLSQEVIWGDIRRYEVVAWGKNDSFLIVGYGSFGMVDIVLPLLDNNNVINNSLSCHNCTAWEETQLAIDLENALVSIRDYGEIDKFSKNALHSLINENKDDLTDKKYGFLQDKDYPRVLQSLGFPIARKPPKYWEMEGGFRISHIGRELRGVQRFFNSPILVKDKLPIQIVPIEKERRLVRGNSIDRGRVLRFKSDDRADKLPSNILSRLNDIGLSLQKNYPSLEQNTFRGKGKEQQKDKISFINSLKRKYSASQNLSYATLIDEHSCLETFGETFYLGINYQYWKHESNEFLLFEAGCQGLPGSGGFGGSMDDLFIFSLLNNYHQPNVSLAKILSQKLKKEKRNVNDYLNNGSFNFEFTTIKDFFSEKSFFLILSVGYDDSWVIVFDAVENQIKGFLTNLPEVHDLHSLYISQNNKLVLQINQTGHFYLYDILSQKRVLNGLYIDDEIVFYTDDGFYDGTLEGARYVTWHYPGLKQHFDFSQFEPQFKRPDIIKSILTGQKIQKPDVQVLPPPSVEMVLTHPGEYSKNATVELKATSILPLASMRLFVNGAPVAEVPVSGKEAQTNLPLELKRGKHWITAVAYNKQGYSSIPQSLLIDTSQENATGGNLYAVGVGVDYYPNIPVGHLRYAKRDITSFVETVAANSTQQYEHIYVGKLLDAEVTSANIQHILEYVVNQSTADDMLLLYFAGHGDRGKDGNFYFLTSNSSFDDFETNGLAWEKVADLLAQTKAKVVVFLDACHSGVASQETVVPNDEYVAELMKAGKAGMAVMAASKGRQSSFEYAELGGGHGVFNYVITQALGKDRHATDTNQNGIIELSELYRSVKFNVHKLTKGKQTPWLSRNEIIGEMPLL